MMRKEAICLPIKFEEGESLDDFEEEKIISTLMSEEILSIEEQPKEFKIDIITIKMC